MESDETGKKASIKAYHDSTSGSKELVTITKTKPGNEPVRNDETKVIEYPSDKEDIEIEFDKLPPSNVIMTIPFEGNQYSFLVKSNEMVDEELSREIYLKRIFEAEMEKLTDEGVKSIDPSDFLTDECASKLGLK